MSWQKIDTAPKDGTHVVLYFGPITWTDAYHITDADEFRSEGPRPVYLSLRAPICFEGVWWNSGSPNGLGSGWYSHNRYKFLKEPIHRTPLLEKPE